MSVVALPALTPAVLDRLLASVDSAVILVAPRLLRRIIKYDRQLTHLGLQVPHRKSYVIGRDALLALATPAELDIDARRVLPATVILLYQLEPERLAAAPPEETLMKYWRLLFHAHVHEALASRFRAGAITDAALRGASINSARRSLPRPAR